MSSLCRCRNRRHVPSKAEVASISERKKEDERAQKIVLKAAAISQRLRDTKQDSMSRENTNNTYTSSAPAVVRGGLPVTGVQDPAGCGYVRLDID
mmetsp:Transcript_12360/g.29025  ORF Transcript_12360/g.29025 Transcript_12360/m.29025 type:complete len:95 (+) Transcript_12360:110-394(+)|eukprot:CAMPEP_0178431738 /NCGR_PEP_ID=MMETSP0689_2-20121128/32015_1 /TAXON_ID=160604 /ORGANISM="Amphidinium massartii, Strain CS-259" /LENGTH=94 /DNA_ID=CAMNT_0020053685 /DNA_START=110 /DNA_END=394 /DNA_ORIENTATION=-